MFVARFVVPGFTMPLKVNRDDQQTINLTPLIDIVFLLIIFFLVGTRFSELNEQEKSIQLEVPSVGAGAALTAAPKKRVINILADGTIVLDGDTVSLGELHEELEETKAQYQQLGVIVRGDASSKYQNVADVIATCKRAEISDLNISVRVASANKASRNQ